MTDKKTLEEALAAMEASNAKAAELRAKQAPDLIAEAVKRTEVNARLSALPLEQRKQVLEAAGLNKNSTAPIKVSRADLRNSKHPRRQTQRPEIDWVFWRGMQVVTLWQACALVVGLNPDELKFNRDGWMAGPGGAPIFDDTSFPNQAVKERFGKALRLAESAVSYTGGPIVAQGTPHSGSKQRSGVLLSQVVAHFVACEWAGIPEQLNAIAQTVKPVETPKPESYPAIKKEGYILKKSAMVKKYLDTWQTIEADFNHASENDLSKVAKATKHGEWYETAALEWADQRGKRTERNKPLAPTSVFALPGKKHTLKG